MAKNQNDNFDYVIILNYVTSKDKILNSAKMFFILTPLPQISTKCFIFLTLTRQP